MIAGILKETFPSERRVALVPDVGATLQDKDVALLIEAGAGTASGFSDAAYEARNFEVVADRAEIFGRSNVLLQVRTPGANPVLGEADLAYLKTGQILIGLAEPLMAHTTTEAVARLGVVLFGMELIPRITRAQSMDVLSSMATVAGYKAALLAANELSRMFPLMMTASGTLTPARVLVIGAGVAGLQAIATCRRLGAVVQAYDVRSAVKEQVESLGANFVDLALDTGEAEDAGGYARAQDDAFYDRQREALAQVVAANDVVITTAAIPGQTSPLLITEDAVRSMAAGSVIIDLAAEHGGNCALTRADEIVVESNVKIFGPTNLPATAPYHASQMYANNLIHFLELIIDAGQIVIDLEDEIVRETLVARNGAVVNARVKEAMNSE